MKERNRIFGKFCDRGEEIYSRKKMAIPLGRTFMSDPAYMLWQVIVTMALFLIVLGAVDYLLAVASFFANHAFSSESHHMSSSLAGRLKAYCLAVPLRTIFTHTIQDRVSSTSNPAVRGTAPLSSPPTTARGTTDELITTVGGNVHFLLLHLIAAVLSSFLVARVIQRRKFVTDFTLTIYTLYILMAWVVLGSFPAATLWWWVCVGGGAITMWTLMTRLCQQRELEDVELAPIAVAPTSSSSGGGGGGGSGGRMGPDVHLRSKHIAVGGNNSVTTAALHSPAAAAVVAPPVEVVAGGARETSPTPPHLPIEMTPNSIKRR